MHRITVHVVAQPRIEGGTVGVDWFDEILERIDRYDIDRVSIGDVQGNHLECFAGLGYVAARTRRVGIGPIVTSAVGRDVGVLAAAAATLDAISAGRAFLTFGRGDGLAHNLDLPAHSVSELAEVVAAVRSLLRDGVCEYTGRTITLPWPAGAVDRVPLYAAAGGPRMLRMAATVCDGVYVATGCLPLDVAAARAAIDAVPRHTPLDVWWVTRFGIGETFGEAVATASEGLSSIGNHALRGDYAERGVPEELWPSLREYHARYDYSRKNTLAGDGGAGHRPTNVDLMNELGLRDYLIERFGIVGTPEQVVARLRELAGRGVDSVMLLASSITDLDLIGTRVLPALAEKEIPGPSQP